MNRLFNFLLCLLIGLTSSTYIDYDGWLNVELYHAIDGNNPNEFTLRGNITVTSLSSGSVSLAQESLSPDQRNLLKSLAVSNRLYRLKAIVIGQDSKRLTYYTSSRACALVKSHLNDVLWVSLDHVGSVIGVSHAVGGSSDCSDLNAIDAEAIEEFNTDVYIKHMELAPVPDTASFIQKIEREREARDRGEVKDNRGFFAKYWMYIVPVAILVLISGATNPDAGGAGGAGGGGGR